MSETFRTGSHTVPAKDIEAVRNSGDPLEIVKQEIKNKEGNSVKGYDGDFATVTLQISLSAGVHPATIKVCPTDLHAECRRTKMDFHDIFDACPLLLCSYLDMNHTTLV